MPEQEYQPNPPEKRSNRASKLFRAVMTVIVGGSAIIGLLDKAPNPASLKLPRIGAPTLPEVPQGVQDNAERAKWYSRSTEEKIDMLAGTFALNGNPSLQKEILGYFLANPEFFIADLDRFSSHDLVTFILSFNTRTSSGLQLRFSFDGPNKETGDDGFDLSVQDLSGAYLDDEDAGAAFEEIDPSSIFDVSLELEIESPAKKGTTNQRFSFGSGEYSVDIPSGTAYTVLPSRELDSWSELDMRSYEITFQPEGQEPQVIGFKIIPNTNSRGIVIFDGFVSLYDTAEDSATQAAINPMNRNPYPSSSPAYQVYELVLNAQ